MDVRLRYMAGFTGYAIFMAIFGALFIGDDPTKGLTFWLVTLIALYGTYRSWRTR